MLCGDAAPEQLIIFLGGSFCHVPGNHCFYLLSEISMGNICELVWCFAHNERNPSSQEESRGLNSKHPQPGSNNGNGTG